MNANVADTSGVNQPNGKSGDSRGVLIWLTKSLAGILMMVAILFIPAGRLDWVMGWVYIGVFVLVTAVTALVADPELLMEERGRAKEDTESWDKVIFTLYSLVSPALATPLVAALDVRFEWLPGIPLAVQIGALVVYVLGWAVHLWAMASNKFFSRTVRIQEDRGQTVATGGPYRYVRHPGYIGGVLLQVAAPITLGSLWALIPGGLGALLLIIRTALEDGTLLEKLDGYKEYAQRVRYRLIPGIW